MGEDTFDGESFAGSFVAGCDGAQAGIVILGDPSKGAFYRQELYEDEAEDWGKVLTFKTIDGRRCMKTKEWTPLEPGAVEHKTAPRASSPAQTSCRAGRCAWSWWRPTSPRLRPAACQ